jgi:hypothetical protein
MAILTGAITGDSGNRKGRKCGRLAHSRMGTIAGYGSAGSGTHENMKSTLRLLLFLIFSLSGSHADEAAAYLHLNPTGIKVRLEKKGTAFFIDLTRRPVKDQPEGTQKIADILMAKSSPYVIEVNDDRFAVLPEGMVSCTTGALLGQSEEGWKVLTSPGSLAGFNTWSSGKEEDYDGTATSIEAHPSVQKAPVISVEAKPTKGVFLGFNRSPAYCECGVLFEELVRSTLRDVPSDASKSLHNVRHEPKLLID